MTKGTLNPIAIFIAITILSATVGATSTADDVIESVENFYKNLNKDKLVLTKLKYYIHANFGVGPTQTVFEVARSNITGPSTNNFGRILIIDNKLTVGPDVNSQKVGQYQGMNAYSDFNQASANMNMNIIYTDGEYKGSTISILGRQPVPEKIRVLSIIGGTGLFRFARGTVLASTYSSDPATNVGVYVYDIYVVTPFVGKSHKAV
ncbi:hypothetical protein RD792_005161 [Penstemon davidsonii]|uniref:Dirigent protein n=1 Tax=Penstemon davidsonii TaxID=160366 RepID=A0ABR0DJF5_9LAMI|nr:hypothetical protein RD792_005161 [Penstemon davidsonii]